MREGVNACKDADDLWPCQLQLPIADDVISCGDWLAGEASCKRLTLQLRVAHRLRVCNSADYNNASPRNCSMTYLDRDNSVEDGVGCGNHCQCESNTNDGSSHNMKRLCAGGPQPGGSEHLRPQACQSRCS